MDISDSSAKEASLPFMSKNTRNEDNHNLKEKNKGEDEIENRK